MTDAYRVRVSPRNAKELRGALASFEPSLEPPLR
tara:strand:+ start:1197 stop:1298 length:102 start_codon:yes stop_codon:yes gene_type:complete